jgi:hypothetical protein
MQQTLLLSFQLPDGESRELELKPSASESVQIGRNRASTIKLSMPSVSRQHARIFFEGGAYWIEDLGSSNGTFVNREQVHRARISAGDFLQCGEFALEVLSRGERGAGSAQAGGIGGLSTAPSLPPFMGQEPARARGGAGAPSAPPARQSAPPRRTTPTSEPVRAQSPTYDQDLPTSQSFPPSLLPRLTPVASSLLSSQESSDRWHSKAPTNTPTPLDERLTEDLERARVEVQRLKEREASLSDQLRGREDEVTTLRAQVDAHRALSEKQRQELKALEGAQASLSRQLESLEREREGAKGARAEVEDLKAELGRLRDSFRSADAMNSELRSALKEERERVASVTQSAPRREQLEALEERVVVLEAERDEALVEVGRVRAEALEAQRACRLAEREAEEAAELVRGARAEVVRLEGELRVSREGVSASQAVSAVLSLPRPNESATSPDWALHQARFALLKQELRELRRGQGGRVSPSSQLSLQSQPQPQPQSIPPSPSEPRRESEGQRAREWRGLV